jgi:hypothetical protein
MQPPSPRRRSWHAAAPASLESALKITEHGSRDTCLAAAGLDLAGLTASIERWWSAQDQGRMIRSVSGI